MIRESITSVSDCGDNYIIEYTSKAVMQRKGPKVATELELDPNERIIVDFCKLFLKQAEPKTITDVDQVKVGMVLGWENGMGFKAHGPVYLEDGVMCIAIGAGRYTVTGLLEKHEHLNIISE
jgi:hypothetical protein